MLRSSAYQRLGYGLYAPTAGDLRLLDRVAAVMLMLPADTVITGVTALNLRGVDVGDPLPVRAVTASGFRSKRFDVRLIRAQQLPPHRRRLATSAASWVAACVELDLLEIVTAGDTLIRLRQATRLELMAAARRATGRGCRLARRAAELIRDRVDSPRETRLRLMLVLAGLPTPECNVVLGDDQGPVGRVDMLLEEFKLILEYDGDQHRTDRTQWNIDLDRNDAFSDLGYLTVRVTGTRMRRPRDVLRRVFAKLVGRGYQGPPPDFNAEWCALFER